MDYPQYICILDFEATCDNKVRNFDHEIIEFPSVLMKFNGTNYDPITEFQRFCKPSKKPIVSRFCFELTGITQQQVNLGLKFKDVLVEHFEWLRLHTNGDVPLRDGYRATLALAGGSPPTVLIVTCGKWDLDKMMVAECLKWRIIPNNLYHRFLDIKQEFQTFYKNRKGKGMAAMLVQLNIPLEGRHHSGICDCRNTAKIWQRMVKDGYQLNDDSIIKVDGYNTQN